MGRWGGAVGHHRARGDPLTSPFPPPPPHTAPEEEPAVEGECAKGVQGGAGGKRALVQMLAVPLRPMGGRRVSGGAGLCKRRRRRRPMGRAEGRGLHRECAMQAGLGGGVCNTRGCARANSGACGKSVRGAGACKGALHEGSAVHESVQMSPPRSAGRRARAGFARRKAARGRARRAVCTRGRRAGPHEEPTLCTSSVQAAGRATHTPPPSPPPFPPTFARGVQRNPPPYPFQPPSGAKKASKQH